MGKGSKGRPRAGGRRRRVFGLEGLERRELLTVSGLTVPLTAQILRASDLDGNGMIIQSKVQIDGQTSPMARILIDRNADGRIDQMARANILGRFRVSVPVDLGQSTIRIVAVGRQGGSASTTVEVTRGDVVLDWNNVVLEAIRLDKTNPPKASRAMAMIHVAMYDAINSVDPQHDAYLTLVDAPRGTSAVMAAGQAAYQVATSLFPNQKALFDQALAETIASVPLSRPRSLGMALGNTVADAVLAARANDGSTTVVPYTPGTDVGDWVPTPPGFAPALLPNWPYVTPFGIESGDQFRLDPPPTLDSAEYTAAFAEVQALGAANSTIRTPDQSAIALFWADGAGTFTPPGHWNQIAENVALDQKTSLAFNARLFALLDVALADAAIVCWDTKYTYNLWRPVTAIRNADLDGNPDTTADPTWSSFIATPPFPTYTSGHSTFSGAASTILASFFGDDYTFSDPGDAASGTYGRSFTSFSQAAEEAGRSRIYGGIHFQFDNGPALAAGRALAAYVLDHVLT